MRTNDKILRQRPNSALDGRPDEPIDIWSGGSNPCNAPTRPIGADARVSTKGADAKLSLPDRLATLPNLSLGDLRLEWRRLFRAEPPRLSRDIMMRAIAYRLQEIAHGGLSRITQRRLMTLANELASDGRISPPPGPRIKPGARLIREWHGRTHSVCVTETGFEFEGKIYRSLTKIARDITGAQWSGPRFFGLTKTLSVAAPDEALDPAAIAEDTNG
jgi:hypothetical protein